MRLYFLYSLALCFSISCSSSDEHAVSTQYNESLLTSNTDSNIYLSYPIERVLFTDAQSVASHTSDPVILDELAYYIDHTVDTGVIYMSIYELDYEPVVTGLQDAYQRGVEIHLLIDLNWETTRNFNANTFPEFWNLQSPSEFIKVNNDSHANVMNHEKVAIFSGVSLPEGHIRHLVFATSSNFKLGATKRVNDTVIIADKSLYDAFLDNWENITYYAPGGMANFQYQAVEVNGSINDYFFPRRENGS